MNLNMAKQQTKPFDLVCKIAKLKENAEDDTKIGIKIIDHTDK